MTIIQDWIKRILILCFCWFLFLALIKTEAHAAGAESIPDILLTWDAATEREDGSRIENLDGYRLYYSVNNGEPQVIPIEPDKTEHLIIDVSPGIHSFQISSVEDDLEGAPSRNVSVPIDRSKPKAIMFNVEIRY